MENIVETYFTGGDDGANPTTADWSNAFAEFIDEDVHIMHPAGCTDPVVHQLLLEHCLIASNQKMERIMVVGGALDLKVGDWSTPDTLLNGAYNFNSGRALYVTPGTDNRDASYTAAKITGLIASVDVATPLTYKTIKSTATERKFTITEKEALVTGGCLVVDAVKQGYRIIRGITSAQDLSRTTEDPYKELTIQRIADFIGINIREILEAAYIGKKGLASALSDIIHTTSTALLRMKDAELIIDYRNVVAKFDVDNPKIVYVDYYVLPVQPISWIFVTTKLVNS